MHLPSTFSPAISPQRPLQGATSQRAVNTPLTMTDARAERQLFPTVIQGLTDIGKGLSALHGEAIRSLEGEPGSALAMAGGKERGNESHRKLASAINKKAKKDGINVKLSKIDVKRMGKTAANELLTDGGLQAYKAQQDAAAAAQQRLFDQAKQQSSSGAGSSSRR